MKYLKLGDEEHPLSVPVAESYRDCIELIRSDYYRREGKRASLLAMWFAAHKHAGTFGYIFWLRLSSYKGVLYPLFRLKLFFSSRKFGIQIYPVTRIGYGFYVGHGIGLVVNPTTVIGNNVNLSQFTTIGSNKRHAATIGNNVYVGPSVCIIEDVRIGDNATIGAGAVVTRDVPHDTTVAGVPARVIHNSGHPEYVGHRWEWEER